MTAAEMAHVKNFFRLPKEATKEQVSFVAAAVTFQAARDKRAGASRQNEAAKPAVAKKKCFCPLGFVQSPPPPPRSPRRITHEEQQWGARIALAQSA
jgi:hypothetical protein